MTGVSWAVSAAGVVVAALCIIGLRHHHHLPSVTHAISQRLAIAFAYVAGCAVAETALGSYVTQVLGWVLSAGGGASTLAGHAGITIAGMALVGTVAAALVFIPQASVVWLALATPFVLQLAGGHLHALMNIVPAQQVVETISHWIGG